MVKKDLRIERFLSKEITLKSGKKARVCITVKHSLDKNGRLIYSIEAMDIKNALEKTRAKGQPSSGLSNNSNIAQDYTVVNKKDKENPAVKKSFASIVNELKKSYFDNIGA